MDPNPPTARPAPPARRKGRTSAPPTDSADNSPTLADAGPSFKASASQGQVSPEAPEPLSTTVPMVTERRPSGSSMEADLLSTQEMEAAFGQLAKEDLLLALQRAKQQMDRLEEVVSSQTLEIESLQSGSSDLSARLLASDTESNRLTHLVQQREARIDELNNDQARLEDEVYSKLGIVERLKTRADEGERKRAEAERKLADALQMADKEREYFQDQEAHLKAANARLTGDLQTLKQQRAHLKEVIRNGREDAQSHPEDGRSTADGQDKQPALEDEALEQQQNNQGSSLLEEELEQLRKTLASQDAALVELRAKLNDERNRSVQLEEDKIELESMLTGNTLEQLMKSKASGQWRPNYRSETTGSVSSRSQDDTTDATSESLRPWSEEASDAAVVSSGEITTTPKPRIIPGSSTRAGEGDNTDEASNVEKELNRLRQENKRLTTYVTKILNRIMSMEGFERVLAADSLSADGTRTLRGTLDKPATPRPTILPPATGSTSAKVLTVEQKKERRRSSGLLGLSRARSPLLSASPNTEDALTISPTPSSAGLAAQPSQTASRTSSVDWKSLRLPWSSGAEEKTNPNLRPFALSTSSSRLEGPAIESKIPSPRLPDLEEEYGDDADEMERQRARTLLQMEGLTVPPHQLTPVNPTVRTAPPPAPGGFTSFLSRMMTTEPAPAGSISKTTTTSATPASTSAGQNKQDLDSSGRLTEPSKSQRPRRPVRGDSASSSSHSLGRSDSSSGRVSLIGHSRIDSVAGDESYALAGIIDLDKREAAEAPAPGWRTALKRMSLMSGSETPAQL
ncbi:hypothetical protein BCV69DRAFT_314058 [Microstroma glucosiphilum]|uniref:Uncharacterized protein n=1 Tax=Pseudomicrostroma glucosiphilum TaxID=1684307 RepID=A0A316U8M0_9BASI|nr:hypothetical protein BCV69DRAFT_314058 [Pseudomicrostroma glucosiphilum]PWN19325.1 hypothetical protein BCV69DRAFT_314058 [Pseudomicrostroma glucosiphilum]